MALWFPLESIARGPSTRFGNKALALAQLKREGAPVLDGWVLPADAADELAQAAAELRALAPQIERWILRSSSPLEDRPGASGAGLFHSAIAAPSELEPALASVRASAHGEAARAVLGATAPLAVLAQPYRAADCWLTVECRADGSHSAEGRRGDIALRDEQALAALNGWPRWRAECRADGQDLLLELLQHDGRWWILQRRPAPSTAVASGKWRIDRAHAIRPLCPLFASLLEALSDDESRLLQGVWYERERSRRAEDPERLLARSQRQLADCAQAVESLRGQPQELAQFGTRWTELNRAYFARPTAALRAALAEQPPRAGALANSLAAQRLRELAAAPLPLPDALLQRHGHVARWPWDGRSASAWEDPAILLELRGASCPPPDTEMLALADRIALHLEDDDEVLARLYALLRLAVRDAVAHAGLPAARWEEALELELSTLLRLLPHAGAAEWDEAVARGRARAADWAHSLHASSPKGRARGVGIVPGRVQARLCRREFALQGGLPEPGVILVVSAITPLDAVVFPRLAALVVEHGDRLGHASILAREHGVPTLVDVGVLGAQFRDGVTAIVDTLEGTLALP